MNLVTAEPANLYEALKRVADIFHAGELPVQDRQTRQIVKFFPNDAQKIAFGAALRQASRGGPVEIAEPKFRRGGISTLWQYVIECLCWMLPNRNGLTVAHTKEDTAKIFRIAGRCGKALGAQVAAGKVVFPNGSMHECLTGGSRGGGAGSGIDFLHFTELALLQRAQKLDADAITNLVNTTADSPWSMRIYEGTGKGPDGEFYRICKAAEVGQHSAQLVFHPWFTDPKLRLKAPESFEPDEEERMIAVRYSLDREQLYWRRRKLAQHPSRSDFNSQYPSCLDDCFEVATGRVFFTFARDAHVVGPNSLKPRPDITNWDRYRGFDWNFASNEGAPAVWLAHDPSSPPRLSVDEDCTETIKQFLSWGRNEKTGKPIDDKKGLMDCIRYVVVTRRLRGWVHIYRESLELATPSLSAFAKRIHEMSGWHVPESALVALADGGAVGIDLGRASGGDSGEQYVGNVADRSRPEHINQFRQWAIAPIEGQISPVAAGLKKENESRGELEDGIGIMLELLAGEHLFASPTVDPLQDLKDRIEASRPQKRPDGVGYTRRRFVMTTPDERRALADDRQATEDALWGRDEDDYEVMI